MARIPRVVLPDFPHHVTQRGNRRQRVFHRDEDYAQYLDLLARQCRNYDVAVWAYCLMPNHVHLILTPSTPQGLSRAVGETHRRYTAVINAREQVTGHLFQARFNSVAMDEAHLLAALRYVAMNPVEAGLVDNAADWRWSSARAQLAEESDGIVDLELVSKLIPDFAAFLDQPSDPEPTSRLLSGQTIGRPLMAEDRLERLERTLGRRLRPLPRGPRPKAKRGRGRSDK